MFEVLKRFYRIEKGESYKAIGELLGCSETVVRTNKLIDEETYENILVKIKVNSPLTPEEEKQNQKWNKKSKWNKIESGDGS